MRSGRSVACYPRKRFSVISSQRRLAVKVMKKLGLPKYRTMAIESWKSCYIKRLLPVKLDGRINRRPRSPVFISSRIRASISPV
jgi:hypothetical protein